MARIFDLVVEERGCTRARIQEVLGCTRPSVNDVVRTMIHFKVVTDVNHVIYPLYRENIANAWVTKHEIGSKQFSKLIATGESI